MYKKIFFLIILIYLFIFTPQPIFAQDFDITRDINYQVSNGPDVSVSEFVTIKNLTTEKYAQNFDLTIKTQKLSDIAVFQDQKHQPMDWQLVDHGDFSQITVALPTVIGKNQSQTLLITYKLISAASHQGEVTELNLPQLDSSGNSTAHVILELPPQLNNPAYIYPQPDKQIKSDTHLIYEFTQNTSGGIRAIFGDHQLYQFTIFYHLNKNDVSNNYYQLTFPPDTAYQKIALTQLSQNPDHISTDPDGNWIAYYPATTANSPVVVTGVAMVFAKPIVPVSKTQDLKIETQSQLFWEQSPEIKAKASELQTPEEIYKYVVNTLQYDYKKQGTQDSRQGAPKAMSNPTFANCMEFTDLFISLARSANIPARRVIGYANSTNLTLQPLSLQGDILHAWPEYFNQQTGQWVPTDPTWGNTSRGFDYFHSWDLAHLTLSINGASSEYPPTPGSNQVANQTKNLIIVPAGDFPPLQPQLDYQAQASLYWLPLIKPQIRFLIKNQTGIGTTELKLADATDDSVELKFSQSSVYLPAFGLTEVKAEIDNRQWLLPDQIRLLVNGKLITIKLPTQYRLIQIAAYIISILIYALASFATFRLTRQAWRLPVRKQT